MVRLDIDIAQTITISNENDTVYSIGDSWGGEQQSGLIGMRKRVKIKGGNSNQTSGKH